nr:MAG TPA: hypothetical protein [Caudoviricetes sp.]
MNKNEENKVGSVLYCIREKFKASILFHMTSFMYDIGAGFY